MEIKRKSGTAIPYWLFFCLLTLLDVDANVSPSFYNSTVEIQVGVILDMGSWTGQTIHSCIAMALSDYYASKSHYKTRIVLETRDSKGDLMHAISAALDLLENVEVQIIIGPETHLEAKFLAILGDKARVPMFSFSSIHASSGKFPFLVQIKQDETSQFKGIASVLKSFQWRTVNVICEDSDDGREILPYLADSLKDANIHVAYRLAISPFSDDGQILKELKKLLSSQTTINVVHMSPFLASRLFLNAKSLGMARGYAWLITDKTIDQLHTLDGKVIESMQGALGFQAYIPASKKLQDITWRWRKEFTGKDPTKASWELDVLGIWAYDTMWALAESVERIENGFVNAGSQSTGSSSLDLGCDYHSGTRLLNEIAATRFTGLSGEFQISGGKLHSESYVIVNVIGRGERRVGFWTTEEGIVKETQPSVVGRHPSTRSLEAVIWPGGSTIAPKGWQMLTGGRKLRIAVHNNPGFQELVHVNRDPQTNETIIGGFCVDVFEAAIKSLDYEVPYEFIPFVNERGENLGSLTDLINQVYLENYDGIVADVTITANRSLYVDFTSPFTDLGLGTITRHENSDMWVFSRPLHPNLWFTSAAFFVLVGLVVWAIEHPIDDEFQGSLGHQLGTILWFGFSTLVFAHKERLTSNLSRFVVIVWVFVVLILTASYTATLSSILTVQQIQLASAGEYIGIQGGSFLGGVIARNSNFKDDRLLLYFSPEEYADALSKGRKKGGVTAIVDEIPYIKIFLAKYGADYSMVASTSATNGFGFVFQKGNSPLVSDISRAILKLREEGRLGTMEKAWFKSEPLMPEHDTATANILNLKSFSGLFLISWLSCVLALLLHLLSMVIRRWQVWNIIVNLLQGGYFAFVLRLKRPETNQRGEFNSNA